MKISNYEINSSNLLIRESNGSIMLVKENALPSE